MAGLLIVNADDWGASTSTTDAILACMTAGTVTSASAMVHMPDSERAAEVAREHGLAIGLHLNLTQPFGDDGAPADAAATQRRVAERLLNNPRRTPDPRLIADIRRSIADQLDAFRAAYRGEPTHVDGHNHVHLNPLVLAALPRGIRVRTAAAATGGAARAVRRWALARRFRTTTAFASIRTVHPRLGGKGLDELLDLARTQPVEIMTHPAVDDELELLLSDEWRGTVSAARLGSYADLP